MSRSAAHAASHPCYAFPGYRCECGTESASAMLHYEHVVRAHRDDDAVLRRVLPAKQYDRLAAARPSPGDRGQVCEERLPTARSLRRRGQRCGAPVTHWSPSRMLNTCGLHVLGDSVEGHGRNWWEVGYEDRDAAAGVRP